MTKTVKQVVDEYNAKQNEQNYDYSYIRVVSLPTTSWEDTVYHNVSNLVQKDIGDERFMELQFDVTSENGTFHKTKIGKVVESSSHIKEE